MAARRRRMHPARPFVIAILLLCAIALFSHVRESIRTSGPRDSSLNLVRRDHNNSLEEGDEKCRHVHRASDQCAFIKANCPDEEAGLLSYLTLYYCELPQVKPVGFLIIAFWTALLFTTIGVAASDFFCINLSTISNILGMSESLAGVTFLAFGNGSPDVFSTFAAIKSHSGSLAIGELIGAAGFITAVVSGSMALVRPFKVARRSFVRDIGFFIVSISFSMVFLANGSLTLWECAVMVAFYVFYVIIVVIWHWWLTRARRRREREAAIRGHYTIPGSGELEAEEAYHDDDDDRDSPRSFPPPISGQDLQNLERADWGSLDDYADLDDEETRDKWMGELSSNMRLSRAADGGPNTVYTPIRPSLVGALEFRAVLSSLQKSRNIQSMPINMRRYSDAPYYTSAQQQDAISSTSDPEGAQGAYDASMEQHHEERDRLAVDRRAGYGTRNRAVSANDAAGLRLVPGTLESRRHFGGEDLLSSSPVDMDGGPSDGNYPPYRDFPSPREESPAPLVSVSPPPEEAQTAEAPGQAAEPATRPQTLLAPPDASASAGPSRVDSMDSSHSAQGSTTQPSQRRPSRPRLRLPLPPSLHSTPRHTPHQSPYLVSISSKSASRTPSLLLPPPSNSVESFVDDEVAQMKPKWWPYQVLPPPNTIVRTLFPTLYDWHDKTVWERFLGLCSAPSFFVLTITLPVVEPTAESTELKHETPQYGGAIQDFATQTKPAPPPTGPLPKSSVAAEAVAIEETQENPHVPPLPSPPIPPPPADHTSIATSNSKEWNRWLVIIQCFTAPFFVVFIVWANTSGVPRELIKPTLYSLLGSLVALLLLLVTTTPTRPPKWHFLLCFVGFAVSITWISSIANEVVGVLKTIGVIFNMSDAILGLTIFAVGNSLGDFVADITVARLGYPVMALSACFGGPMLNILLGIGLSGLYMTITGAEKRRHKHPDRPVKFKPYHVQLSTTLLISAVALLITLVGLLIFVPLNGWKMDRRIGIGLIALWIVSTVCNVVVEVTGNSDDFYV